MYKLLLCWRYLRTRYIALICIISVTLGVATLIVVNSVMAGFTHEMQVRLNGVLGDLVVESRSMDGAPNAANHMSLIRKTLGDQVVGMSPLVQAPALMYLEVHGADGQPHTITRQVTLLGIDEETYADVSDFGQYLQHPDNRERLDFQLRDRGYDQIDHQAEDPTSVKPRPQMEMAGWRHRRAMAERRRQRDAARKQAEMMSAAQREAIADPFAAAAEPEAEAGRDFNPAIDQHTGIVLGISVCSFRAADGSDYFHALPGDDVKVSFPKASIPPEAISSNYTIVDFYESKLGEYDSNFVFVPLRSLQESRGLVDPETGVAKFNSIQIKLTPGADANAARDTLQAALPLQFYVVSTWRDKQGPLLAAVNQEMVLLNVLLFLIIAVAGFGILAIFLMIVVEKTRDIGIMKSLGASRYGVMGIFLSYGLSLGVVGSGAGLVMGLLFVKYIHEIAEIIGHVTGRPVFDPAVYYLPKIPTIVDPLAIAWVMTGAIVIAVMASVLPAWRAANLHPVRAPPLRITTQTRQNMSASLASHRFVGPSPAVRLAPPPDETEPVQHGCCGLVKGYRKGSVGIPVLQGIDLEVQRGEFLAIVGQSGSGKSTLLHLLGTLDKPDAGEVYFDGHRIDHLPAASRDLLRNRHFGMIFQAYHLLPEFSTLENVLAPALIAESPLGYLRRRGQHRRRAAELLATVGIADRARHKPSELSGGEMQRAAIARSLMMKPSVLLADEPTGNLDRQNGEAVMKTLRELNRREKLTIIMVTHDPLIADQADRTVQLAEGRIV